MTDTPPPAGTPPPPSLFKGSMRSGDMHIRAIGLDKRMAFDFYHRMMQLSWPRLGLLFVSVFLTFNLLFAALYMVDPHGLATAHDATQVPQFWRLFFFSVATVATIGYGNVYPISAYANIVVVIEITLGIIYFALSTGIAFARFSRPTARILFSRTLVVREIDGVPTLMLRAANQRHNMIYQAQARVSLLTDEEMGGVRMRRFVDLELARSTTPAFALTWTIMHPIGSESPLRAWFETPGDQGDREIVVILSGIDESSAQTIHSRWSYRLRDARRGARFVDIIANDDGSVRTIDYRRFHDTVAD